MLAHYTERENPVSILNRGQHLVRYVYVGAGVGGRKKQMPGCNGLDTG